MSMIWQYWQFVLLHLLVDVMLLLDGGLGVGVSLGRRALTKMSLRFLALILPLIRSSLMRGLVELVLSKRSQFLSTILSHSRKFGWNVVMRKVLSFFSSSFSSSVAGLSRLLRSERKTLSNALRMTPGGKSALIKFLTISLH